MPTAQGQLFDILSAVDVAQEATSEPINPSGRVLDVEEPAEDEMAGSGGWRPNAPGKRCLKMALKDVNSDQIAIGIELTRLPWEDSVSALVGKRVQNP
jgi:hypothetical protein